MMGSIREWRGARAWVLAWVMIGAVAMSVPGFAGDVGAAEPLRVGIAPIYPPLAFKKAGELDGIEPEFARRLGERLERPVTFTELPWEELLVALGAGRVDVVMSGMSITAARERQARFTDSYLQVGQMALVRSDDFDRLSGKGALNQDGVRVGYPRGTTSEEYVKKALVRATQRGFASSGDGVSALRNAQIDAWVQDAPAIWRVTGGFFSDEEQLRGLYAPRTEEHLAWAVRLDDTALAEVLDETLRVWKADGTVEDVIDDWIRVRKTSIEVVPPDDD